MDTRRRVITVTAVLAVCAGLGTAAWAFGINSDASSRPDCVRAEYVAPKPDRAPVRVFNSTPVGGLAIRVAGELAKRGFTIGTGEDDVGNDPLRRKIRGTGEIRGGPAGEAQIAALQAWQPGMVIVRDRNRRGPTVDFVMGLKFEKLRDAPEPPPGAPRNQCVPVTSPGAS
ncbi:MAG: LytR C-terminal domain-containing protein [Sporichthyaceae bacterium]